MADNYNPIVRKTSEGYMLGAVNETKKNVIWVFNMTTEDIAKLWSYGVTIKPLDKNSNNTEGRWSGELIFNSYHDAFLIWERVYEPRILANLLADTEN